jgi:hypothetical protein
MALRHEVQLHISLEMQVLRPHSSSGPYLLLSRMLIPLIPVGDMQPARVLLLELADGCW